MLHPRTGQLLHAIRARAGSHHDEIRAGGVAHRDLPSCSTGRNDAKRSAAFYVSVSKAAVPLTAHFRTHAAQPTLFDHLVGKREQRGRYREAKILRGL